MEGQEKPKKVTKEKRSVKKSRTVVPPATEIGTAPVAESKPAGPSRVKKSAHVGKVQEPSFEQIQLEAYFIAERRKRLGVPGDETSDWVEAEAVLKSHLCSK
jgi:hypothetical protein